MVTTKAKAVPLPQKAKSIRLLLVDDHEVVRVGLRTLLSGVPTVLDRHGCEDGASRLRVWGDIQVADFHVPSVSPQKPRPRPPNISRGSNSISTLNSPPVVIGSTSISASK